MKKTVHELATYISGTVVGDQSTEITGITNYTQPCAGSITFVQNVKDLAQLEQSSISCIILPQELSSKTKPCIQVKSPKAAFAQLMQLFHPPRTFSQTLSKTASIHKTSTIGANVTIEDFVTIGKNVIIGDGSTIRASSYIDTQVTIGKNTIIHPHVMIYDKTIIGNNVIIHSGTVIGSDGFGYIRDDEGKQIKIPQVGNVIIEDYVEIGSNVSIDRATFGSTILKNRVKIDNLVQIAHNVIIGEDTTVSGHAGIAGSTIIGKHCTIAAAVGIGDHAVVEDNVIIGGKAGVASKKVLKSNNLYMGVPARPFAKFREMQGSHTRIPKLMTEVKLLKEKFAELEKK